MEYDEGGEAYGWELCDRVVWEGVVRVLKRANSPGLDGVLNKMRRFENRGVFHRCLI